MLSILNRNINQLNNNKMINKHYSSSRLSSFSLEPGTWVKLPFGTLGKVFSTDNIRDGYILVESFHCVNYLLVGSVQRVPHYKVTPLIDLSSDPTLENQVQIESTINALFGKAKKLLMECFEYHKGTIQNKEKFASEISYRADVRCGTQSKFTIEVSAKWDNGRNVQVHSFTKCLEYCNIVGVSSIIE